MGEAEAGQPLRALPATGEAGAEVTVGVATDPIPLLSQVKAGTLKVGIVLVKIQCPMTPNANDLLIFHIVTLKNNP